MEICIFCFLQVPLLLLHQVLVLSGCVTEQVAIGTAGLHSGEDKLQEMGILQTSPLKLILLIIKDGREMLEYEILESFMLFFSPPFLPQGLFFDDSYGFYPGQVLIGPSKVFSSVQWLSGVKPVLSTKSKFRVVVEEVRTDTLTHGHLLPCVVAGWLFGAESACHGNLPRANVWCSEVTNFSLGTGRTLERPSKGPCWHPAKRSGVSTLRGQCC